MTLKQARDILENREIVSLEEISTALSIVSEYEDKHKNNNIPNKSNSSKAYDKWKLRKREEFELRREIKKYWPSNSS